jgi:pimeloyl-ACP methyl ester carboxylesterase
MTTFVLIHGAYQGGWIWQQVAGRIAAVGHTVLTPTLDGCAERAHQLRAGITTESQAEEVVEMLRYYDLNEVVLAATSAGGMVMARVAERARERIARLVFVDALALLDGEKIRDIVTRPAAINTDVGLGPSREDAEERLLVELEPELRRWTSERFSLHPVAVFNEPVKLDAFWDQEWQASVLYCTQAANPGEAHIRRTADRLGGKWHAFDTGHYPMLTMPEQTAELILHG